jgi:hypothetical protein
LSFFAKPNFLQSPKKSFHLPVYANLKADAFASQICSPSIVHVPSYDPRMMDFMDISTDESNGHTSADESSGHTSDDFSSNSSSMEVVV